MSLNENTRERKRQKVEHRGTYQSGKGHEEIEGLLYTWGCEDNLTQVWQMRDDQGITQETQTGSAETQNRERT